MALLVIGVFLVIAFILWEDHLGKRTTFPPLIRLDIWTRGRGKFAVMQMVHYSQMSSFSSWMFFVQLYYQTYKVCAYARGGETLIK